MKQLIGVLAGVAIGGLIGYVGKCRSGACPFTSTVWGGALYGGMVGYLLTGMLLGSAACNKSSESSQSPGYVQPATTPVAAPDSSTASSETPTPAPVAKSDIPNTPLTTLSGQTVVLSDSPRAHPLVLKIGATWCPPCRRMKTELETLRKEFAADQLSIIEVYSGEPASTVEKHASGSTLEILLDERQALAQLFNVRSIPHTHIYDASGVLRYRGAFMTAAEIKTVLESIRAPK